MTESVLRYEKKDKKMVAFALVFLMVSAAFFSYQIYNNLDDGGEPALETESEVDEQIISAKNTLESIGSEIDSMIKLL